MQVIQVLPSDTYRVADLATDGRQLHSTTAHVSRLKSWKVLQESDEEEAVEEPCSSHVMEASSRPTRERRLPTYLRDYEIDRGRSKPSGEADC